MSLSQNRKTVQPPHKSLLVAEQSRAIFRRIFPSQYSLEVVPLNCSSRASLRRRCHCPPCQRSPSIKIASRFDGNTISGLPGNSVLQSRYLRPLCERAARKIRSGVVFAEWTRRIFAETSNVDRLIKCYRATGNFGEYNKKESKREVPTTPSRPSMTATRFSRVRYGRDVQSSGSRRK